MDRNTEENEKEIKKWRTILRISFRIIKRQLSCSISVTKPIHRYLIVYIVLISQRPTGLIRKLKSNGVLYGVLY